MVQIAIPGLPVELDLENGIQINTPFGTIPLDRGEEQRGNSSLVTGPDGSTIQISDQVKSLIQEMGLSGVKVARQDLVTKIEFQSPELGDVSVVLPSIPNMSESDLLAVVLPQIGEIDSQITGKLDALDLEIQQNGINLDMLASASRDDQRVDQALQGVPFDQLRQGSQQLAVALNRVLEEQTAPVDETEQVQAAGGGTAAQSTLPTAQNPTSPQPPVAPPVPQREIPTTQTQATSPVAQSQTGNSATPATTTAPVVVVPLPQQQPPRTPVRLEVPTTPQSNGVNSTNGDTPTLENTAPPVISAPTPSVDTQLITGQRAKALEVLRQTSQFRDEARKDQITLTSKNGQGGEDLLSFLFEPDGKVVVVHISDQGGRGMYEGDPVVIATYDSNGNLVNGHGIPQLDGYLGSFVSDAPAQLRLSEGSRLRSVMNSDFHA
jgi:hypothetical protein